MPWKSCWIARERLDSRMRFLMALTAFLVACSSSEESSKPKVGSGSGQCSQRSGSFIVNYKARSGTCGDVAEVVVNIPTQPTKAEPPCTGDNTYTSDNCEVTYTSDCPVDEIGKGARVRIAGASKWSVDGSYGTAVEQWTALDAQGKAMCTGTYDVTLTKQ